jgi:hypothetical protein
LRIRIAGRVVLGRRGRGRSDSQLGIRHRLVHLGQVIGDVPALVLGTALNSRVRSGPNVTVLDG